MGSNFCIKHLTPSSQNGIFPWAGGGEFNWAMLEEEALGGGAPEGLEEEEAQVWWRNTCKITVKCIQYLYTKHSQHKIQHCNIGPQNSECTSLVPRLSIVYNIMDVLGTRLRVDVCLPSNRLEYLQWWNNLHTTKYSGMYSYTSAGEC